MKIIILVLLLLLFSFNSQKILAHTLDEEGTTTVLMHAEPNDKPLAKQATILHFQIKDSSHNFLLTNCNCSVSILKNGNLVQKLEVKPVEGKASVYDAYVTAIFQSDGTYVVDFIGNPKNKGGFKEFGAHFSLNVAKPVYENNNTLKIPNYITYLGLFGVVGTTIFLVVRKISS